MTDDSHLDSRYFIDSTKYNCPFCNRRHVTYSWQYGGVFDWTDSKKCYIHFVTCNSCSNTSLHLTYKPVMDVVGGFRSLKKNIDLDQSFFYSVPSSFFVVDDRIPKVLRELLTEAEGCQKMNFLTGASACVRKAIYEFTVREGAVGEHYDDKIDSLVDKFPNVDKELFDILRHIKDMTSDKVHEQSWDKWDSGHIHLFLETLKSVFHEVYVIPEEKKLRKQKIRDLLPESLKEREQPPPTLPAES